MAWNNIGLIVIWKTRYRKSAGWISARTGCTVNQIYSHLRRAEREATKRCLMKRQGSNRFCLAGEQMDDFGTRIRRVNTRPAIKEPGRAEKSEGNRS